jgi:predicted RNA-binding protein Jag
MPLDKTFYGADGKSYLKLDTATKSRAYLSEITYHIDFSFRVEVAEREAGVITSFDKAVVIIYLYLGRC